MVFPATMTGFEQFAAGQIFISPPLVVTAEAIKAFGRDFDVQAQHLDEAAASGSIFGTLVASGWHTASLTMRLILASAFAGVGGRGMGVRIQDLTWPAPVYPGDALAATSEVRELRPSRSKPDRGLVILHTITRKQDGAAVLDMVSTCLVLRSDAVLSPP
jgi:acyl dehydratase